MDLLESILRSSNAEVYIETLKNTNLDASTLPLLTDNDLEVLGVDNSNVRKAILEKSATLQIPHEKEINLKVTDDYAELVLNQILRQLHLQHASLTCSLARKDVVVCDIKLHQASVCLLNRIISIERELDRFQAKHTQKQKQSKKKRKYLITGAVTTCLLGLALILKRYIL